MAIVGYVAGDFSGEPNGEGSEQRGFAAAWGAQHCHQLAGPDDAGHAVEYGPGRSRVLWGKTSFNILFALKGYTVANILKLQDNSNH